VAASRDEPTPRATSSPSNNARIIQYLSSPSPRDISLCCTVTCCTSLKAAARRISSTDMNMTSKCGCDTRETGMPEREQRLRKPCAPPLFAAAVVAAAVRATQTNLILSFATDWLDASKAW